ncbi:hypothetical protein WCLP8_350002 [uncultured Gammaproteobacteria bacterium]
MTARQSIKTRKNLAMVRVLGKERRGGMPLAMIWLGHGSSLNQKLTPSPSAFLEVVVRSIPN